MTDPDAFLENAESALTAEMVGGSHWRGELSSSALSTATAMIALHTVDAGRHATAIARGAAWLCLTQNADGGWGDTRISLSNVSTTLLARAALSIASGTESASGRADEWIAGYCGATGPDAIVAAVVARYGADRTFSVPILMACAITGRLGATPLENWRRVLPLPFELGVLPRSWFGALGLPVVSYALPALIAIGHARSVHAPAGFPLGWLRRAVWPRAAALLEQIQPPNGGFLEATPLTAFVTMALASTGKHDHPVVRRAVDFLTTSQRGDGSWPIDTDLATWTTTLAVKAMEGSPALTGPCRSRILRFLLDQQYRTRHPYTDAPPGGWAWTDLPGGVPDADDTPGALLALRLLRDEASAAECTAAASLGIRWLLDLQNRDGGIPTFCRGWGKLPFDRSSPDLTAHTLRAWRAWFPDLDPATQHRVARQEAAALRYLTDTQQADGSWHPLWFGNQHRADEANPTYGTSQVVRALLPAGAAVADAATRGVAWLVAHQNSDGGWGCGPGTPSSVEETALALEALAEDPSVPDTVLDRGLGWLSSATAGGSRFPASPIGFYFAKLWYHEKLYPMVWTVAALRRITARTNRRAAAAGSASS